MAILLWLLPSVLATLAAMVWVSWVGRQRPVGADQSDEAKARFAEAILRPLPQQALDRSAQRVGPRERSTGVALRRPAEGRDKTA